MELIVAMIQVYDIVEAPDKCLDKELFIWSPFINESIHYFILGVKIFKP